jgi:hypothetical protein
MQAQEVPLLKLILIHLERTRTRRGRTGRDCLMKGSDADLQHQQEIGTGSNLFTFADLAYKYHQKLNIHVHFANDHVTTCEITVFYVGLWF